MSQQPNKESTEQVEIRPAVIGDVPFIFNSWLKSYRDAGAVTGIANETYYKEHHDVIERILMAPGAQALIVCNKEHPEQIYAYLVGTIDAQSATIHWLYTKHPFRRLHMARTLFDTFNAMHPNRTVYFSHRTKAAFPLVDALSKVRNLEYNPYKAK